MIVNIGKYSYSVIARGRYFSIIVKMLNRKPPDLIILFFVILLSSSFLLWQSGCSEDVFNGPNMYTGCCETSPLQMDTLGLKLFVPNAITPNNDGINDDFSIYSSLPITIDRLMVAEQNEILAINRSKIAVSGQTRIWSPINASGLPIHGLFNYQLELAQPDGDTLILKGQFCSIDCEEQDTKIIEFMECIFQSVANEAGEIDTTALILENDCMF